MLSVYKQFDNIFLNPKKWGGVVYTVCINSLIFLSAYNVSTGTMTLRWYHKIFSLYSVEYKIVSLFSQTILIYTLGLGLP